MYDYNKYNFNNSLDLLYLESGEHEYQLTLNIIKKYMPDLIVIRLCDDFGFEICRELSELYPYSSYDPDGWLIGVFSKYKIKELSAAYITIRYPLYFKYEISYNDDSFELVIFPFSLNEDDLIELITTDPTGNTGKKILYAGEIKRHISSPNIEINEKNIIPSLLIPECVLRLYNLKLTGSNNE